MPAPVPLVERFELCQAPISPRNKWQFTMVIVRRIECKGEDVDDIQRTLAILEPREGCEACARMLAERALGVD